MVGRRRRVLTARAALLLSAIATLASSVRAESMLAFGLDIEAPPDAQCTDASTLERAIEARVDRLVFFSDPAPQRRILVQITRAQSGRYGAQIAIRDERGTAIGEREIAPDAARCDELDPALVVVISTLIGVAEPPPPSSTEPVAPPEPPRSREAEPRESPADETPRAAAQGPVFTHSTEAAAEDAHSRLRLAAVAAAVGDVGLLPGFAPGAALGFELGFGTFALRLSAELLPYAQKALGDDGGVARFVGLSGETALCVHGPHPFGAELAFCAALEVGAISVRTTGLEADVTRLEAFVRGGLGPELRIPFSARFGLGARAAATLPFYAPRFFVLDASGKRQFYHSVELGVSVQFGVYWLFFS